jgi:hypothetical protein
MNKITTNETGAPGDGDEHETLRNKET